MAEDYPTKTPLDSHAQERIDTEEQEAAPQITEQVMNKVAIDTAPTDIAQHHEADTMKGSLDKMLEARLAQNHRGTLGDKQEDNIENKPENTVGDEAGNKGVDNAGGYRKVTVEDDREDGVKEKVTRSVQAEPAQSQHTNATETSSAKGAGEPRNFPRTLNTIETGICASLAVDRLTIQFKPDNEPLDGPWYFHFRELLLDIDYQYLQLGLFLVQMGKFGELETTQPILRQFQEGLDQEYTEFKEICREERDLDEIDKYDHHVSRHAARALIIEQVLRLKPWVGEGGATTALTVGKVMSDEQLLLLQLVCLNSLATMSVRYFAELYCKILTKAITGPNGASLEGEYQDKTYKELCEQLDDFLDQVDIESRASGNPIVGFVPLSGTAQRPHTGSLINSRVRNNVVRSPGFRDRPPYRNMPAGILPYWARVACMVGEHILTISMVVGLRWNPFVSLAICILLDIAAGVAYYGFPQYRQGIVVQAAFRVDPLMQIAVMHFAAYVWMNFSIRDLILFSMSLTFFLGLNYALKQIAGSNYQWAIYNVFAFQYVLFGQRLHWSWLWLSATSMGISLAYWYFRWILQITQVEYLPLLSTRPILDVPGIYLVCAICAPFLGEGFMTFWYSIILPVLRYIGWEIVLAQFGLRARRSDFIRPILSMLVMNTAMTYMGFSTMQAWSLLMAFEAYKVISNVAAIGGV